MKSILGQIKIYWKQWEDIFWAFAYEVIMIYAAYYAILGRYLYHDYINSTKFALLSILCGLISIISIVRFDYYHVIKGGKDYGLSD